MKRIVVSILSVAFLSGLFVDISFAEETQPIATIQEKASDATSNNVNKSESKAQTFNNSELTGQKNTAEKLKNDLRKYNEKQQELIQKYKNMTNKEFIWDKVKNYLLKFLVACGVVGALFGTYCCGFKYGFDDGYDIWDHDQNPIFGEDVEKGYKQWKDRRKYKGFEQGYKDGFSNASKCNRVLADTSLLVSTLLATFKPDSFPQKGKSFNDVKELYYNATNFYDTYLK